MNNYSLPGPSYIPHPSFATTTNQSSSLNNRTQQDNLTQQVAQPAFSNITAAHAPTAAACGSTSPNPLLHEDYKKHIKHTISQGFIKIDENFALSYGTKNKEKQEFVKKLVVHLKLNPAQVEELINFVSRSTYEVDKQQVPILKQDGCAADAMREAAKSLQQWQQQNLYLGQPKVFGPGVTDADNIPYIQPQQQLQQQQMQQQQQSSSTGASNSSAATAVAGGGNVSTTAPHSNVPQNVQLALGFFLGQLGFLNPDAKITEHLKNYIHEKSPQNLVALKSTLYQWCQSSEKMLGGLEQQQQAKTLIDKLDEKTITAAIAAAAQTHPLEAARAMAFFPQAQQQQFQPPGMHTQPPI